MFRRLRGSAMRMMSSRRCCTKSGQKGRAARKPPPLQKRGFINASKLFEHMIRARHLELAGRFDVELFDDTVVDDHRIALDRKSVVEGKSVSVRVDLGGSRILKKKKK